MIGSRGTEEYVECNDNPDEGKHREKSQPQQGRHHRRTTIIFFAPRWVGKKLAMKNGPFTPYIFIEDMFIFRQNKSMFITGI
jgi:hypothetical protein